MYTTKTKIEENFAVVEVFENGEFWHEYEFPLDSKFNFIDHLSGKIWGTVGNLAEITKAIKNEQHRSNSKK